ncbi:MAG: nitrilase-related carbon-nitrogen hydrolase, partial [Candidatus Micrarchaeota archaeon]|nr:nitrilase-related carbon-nitrogen hydrolase [Candidatus Micrarchaeota archaeon]
MELKIAVCQAKAFADADANLKKAEAQVAQAAKKKADVVCLQEMYRSPYFPQYGDPAGFDYAERVDGQSFKAFSKLARRHKMHIVAPIFEERAPGLYYNSAIVLGPDGKLAGHYRKLHIPQDAHSFSEKYFFAPGDLGYCLVDTKKARIGVLICWDQWYPEAARALALKGAQVLFYPTAIGWHKNEPDAVRQTQRNAWRIMHQSHAIANGVFVAAANRVGTEGNLTFWGSS